LPSTTNENFKKDERKEIKKKRKEKKRRRNFVCQLKTSNVF